MKINLIIGRFNPFTIGHLKLIPDNTNLTCLFIIDGEKTGSNKDKNPLSVDERINYIKNLKLTNIKIYYASSVIEVIDICDVLDFDIDKVICGNDREYSYTRLFPESEIVVYDRSDNINATKVRKLVKENNFFDFDKLMPGNNKEIFDLLRAKLE